MADDVRGVDGVEGLCTVMRYLADGKVRWGFWPPETQPEENGNGIWLGEDEVEADGQDAPRQRGFYSEEEEEDDGSEVEQVGEGEGLEVSDGEEEDDEGVDDNEEEEEDDEEERVVAKATAGGASGFFAALALDDGDEDDEADDNDEDDEDDDVENEAEDDNKEQPGGEKKTKADTKP